MRWFLTGLGLGAALGILYAPRRGSATRSSMGQFASAPETRQRRGGGGGGRSRIRSISSAREEKRNEAPADFLTVINEWPHERLIEIDGIGPVLATKIVSNRPYKTAQELVDSKVLPPSAIEALQKVG